MSYKPYIISTPDFDVTSGGIRVMWALYGYLLTRGQIVYINRYPSGEKIAIYPEIAHGNSVGASTVVRYLLNTPGTMGSFINGVFQAGPTTFDPNDKLYYFSRLFGKAQDENHYMFLPIINLHIFEDQKKIRNKTCYLVGKGQNKQLHPKDSIELTREFATDQQALADLLNECEVMYCYDKLTAMMEVARLCGTRVIYLGDYTREELKLYEPGIYGIYYGLDEWENREKKFFSDIFREHYIDMIKLFETRLDQFIEDTQYENN